MARVTESVLLQAESAKEAGEDAPDGSCRSL